MALGNTLADYIKPWESVVRRAVEDESFRNELIRNPLETLDQAGIVLGEHASMIATMLKNIFSGKTNFAPIPEGGYLVHNKALDAALPDPHHPWAVVSKDYQVTPGGVFGSNDAYVSAEATWYGLVITLSHQAVTDAVLGLDVVSGITAAVAGALGIANAAVGAVVGIVAAFIAASSGILQLTDRGNGVYLTMLWIQFTPIAPPVPIPSPV